MKRRRTPPRIARFALAVAALYAFPRSASASPPSDFNASDPEVHHAVAVEYAWVSYTSARYQYGGQGVGLTYRLGWAQGFELDAGLRGVWGPRVSAHVAPEAFAGASLTPNFGLWQPRIGLEFGYSSVASHRRPPDVVEPRGIDQDYRARVSPLYASVVAAPLRMRVRDLDITVLELDVGTAFPDAGRALRLTVLIGQLTWRIG
jgi:hypothetical protein